MKRRGFSESLRLIDVGFPSSNDSAVRLSNLSLLYDEKTNKISLQAEGSTDQEIDATSAHVLLTAYDRVFYDQKTDLAKVTALVPRFKGQFSFQETFSAPDLLPQQLPKQLFSLPAIEALVSIQLYNAQGNPILCTSVPLTNTVSVHSPVVTIASVSVTAAAIALTAISGIIASLASATILGSIPLTATGGGIGGTNPSGGLSPSVWDVVSFCQFISTSGSLNVQYPEVLKQWTENFGWSMGLIHFKSWNNAIDNLRLRTLRKTSSNDSVVSTTSNATSATGTILYSEIMGKSGVDNTTSGISNKNITEMSMQSIANGTIRSIVEKSGYTGNQTEALAIAKLNATKFLPSSTAFKAEARQIDKRQISNSSETGQPGSKLLPPTQEGSLMNRVSGLTELKALNSQPVVSPNSTMWLQGDHAFIGPVSHRGLPAFGERLQIPAENMFMTSLFLFLILLLITSVLAFVVRISLEAYAYLRPGKFIKIRRRFGSYYIGNLFRVMLLAYFAVATMAFYQLTLKDSWAITTLAAMTLILFIALVTYITLRLRRAGGTSLFFDERLKSRYGAFYDQYVLSTYWFFVPVLAYQILKAAIVGLGNASRDATGSAQDHYISLAPWIQTILLLLVEVCFTGILVWKRPFADKTPNRLNSILGCVRILNVAMLIILIEGTVASTVSRTAIGVIIICTQAMMMIVLACLILYQLGQALWRLYLAIKARNENKKCKENSNPSDREGIAVVSTKDNEKYDKDNSEPQGRMASELSRPGNESMTSLVGMMGIGSNPTIRCTPASDDEDDGLGVENEDFGKDLIHGRYRANNQHTSPPGWKCSEAEAETDEHTQGSIRDSTQSVESHSSLILDYYNPSYLPPHIRSKVQYDDNEDDKQAERNEDGAEGLTNASWNSSYRNTLVIPSARVEEPWVQSAYMTRRRSESSAQHQNIRSVSKVSLQQRLEHDDDDDEEELQLQQQRRRPMSMSAARRSLEPMTFNLFAADARRRDSYSSRRSRIVDAFPTFQGTYIPESLLAGPPPPSSIQRRKSSIVPDSLSSSPSPSPVLNNPPPQNLGIIPSEDLFSSGEEVIQPTGPTTAVTSITASILNFEEYRFPDERSFQVPENTPNAARRAAIIAAQRNIHPLSPFHPDFQHPDDLYNGVMPSPNDEGPVTMSGGSRTSPKHVGFPNILQDGRNSRREIQSTINHATFNAPVLILPKKRLVPGLRIITDPKKMAQPPQIPTLAPLSTSMTVEAFTEAVRSYSLPTTSSLSTSSSSSSLSTTSPVTDVKDTGIRSNDISSNSSPTNNPGQESNKFTNSQTGQQSRNSSSMIDCFLATSPPRSLSTYKQRAKNISAVTVDRPLTCSKAHGDGRAAV
ncbi:hypothetical protein BGZ49_005345 [Haplosporangium sp. Z 27]|nr:hypothetical protein BGZ49_005345 [Haplosporangium sp. Z 27]